MNGRMQAEREIVRATIEAAIKRGFTLYSVDNGEDEILTSSVDNALEYAFECDETRVFFKAPSGPTYAWFYIVLGNEGWTVISDYTTSLEDAVNDTEALVQKWEEVLS